MQIMGIVARELGYDGSLSFLLLPEIGLMYGCLNLVKISQKYQDQEEIIATYNAGSPRRTPDGRFVNQLYVDKVLKEMKN